jgi:pantothenate synthetase
MSSRNRNLSEGERRQALVLSRALRAIESRFQAGEVDSGKLIGDAQRVLQQEPGVQVEYCRIVDPESLEDVSEARPGSLAAIAARVGATRLIDNLLL